MDHTKILDEVRVNKYTYKEMKSTTLQIHKFYSSPHCIFLFLNEYDVGRFCLTERLNDMWPGSGGYQTGSAMANQFFRNGLATEQDWWKRYRNLQMTMIMPNEICFTVEKRQVFIDRTTYETWSGAYDKATSMPDNIESYSSFTTRVIAGEKIGWIIPHKWMEFQLLEQNNE